MKLNQNVFFTTLTLAALTAGAWAQTETASNAAPANPAAVAAPAQPPVTAADIQELKDALAAQQRQIQALQAQLQAKEQAEQVRSAALSANTAAYDNVGCNGASGQYRISRSCNRRGEPPGPTDSQDPPECRQFR